MFKKIWKIHASLETYLRSWLEGKRQGESTAVVIMTGFKYISNKLRNMKYFSQYDI